MEIMRGGTRPSGSGNAAYFTGRVRQDPVVEAPAPARVRAVLVTFEPGARTNWHTHPLGQTLVVTQGFGRCRCWGGPVEELRPGDVVWIPPGEKHWHGAAPGVALVHLAIHESLDGKHVDWLEPVSDEDYGADEA
ncbi:MAG: cupin domain-containing protein [Amaricoccus sp.]